VIGRRRGFLPLPMAAADLIGLLGDIGAWFGIPPQLTRDQAKMLRTDNVASGEGFAALGIRPTAMDVVLPTYLDRFRRSGRFSASRV
jgi:NADH dehydrogenase